jgi:NADP oxidoreductase coenzyme F420-dependent
MRELSRLAVLGAGHVGPVIARLAIKAGYPVAIATSGDPDDIALITELVIPGAQPRWASDAVADADIVVLAIPPSSSPIRRHAAVVFPVSSSMSSTRRIARSRSPSGYFRAAGMTPSSGRFGVSTKPGVIHVKQEARLVRPLTEGAGAGLAGGRLTKVRQVGEWA